MNALLPLAARHRLLFAALRSRLSSSPLSLCRDDSFGHACQPWLVEDSLGDSPAWLRAACGITPEPKP